ncbi:putative RNA-directed DNA polymerase [Helianthus annuus]|nr:putative RNA-directed DNA polymerase [Helianthus annuus]KAJ0650003.1 putative RNA-directed DNA polymerase [Helianthus annuus]
MLGHTVDRCFELVGYPPNFRKRTNNTSGKASVNSKSNAAIASSSSESTSGFPFTPEQIAKLLSLVGDKSANVSSTGKESTSVGGIISWIVDSGASQHMVNSDKDMFNIVDVSDFDLKVGHPNGTSVKVLKIGNVKLTDGIILKDVFYVPGYHVNLISVHRLAKDNGISVVFNENSCVLQDSKSRKVLVTGSQDSGLYFVGKNGNSVNVCFNSFIKSNLWHSRLGHPSDQVLSVLKEMVDVKSIEHGPCDVCHRSKQVRVPFPISEHKSKSIGELIHLDLWGPYKVTSYEGFKYFKYFTHSLCYCFREDSSKTTISLLPTSKTLTRP